MLDGGVHGRADFDFSNKSPAPLCVTIIFDGHQELIFKLAAETRMGLVMDACCKTWNVVGENYRVGKPGESYDYSGNQLRFLCPNGIRMQSGHTPAMVSAVPPAVVFDRFVLVVCTFEKIIGMRMQADSLDAQSSISKTGTRFIFITRAGEGTSGLRGCAFPEPAKAIIIIGLCSPLKDAESQVLARIS